mgnify:CR=1 FL=1
MKKTHLRLLVGLIPIFAIIISALGRTDSSDDIPLYKVIDEYRSAGYITNDYDKVIELVAKDFIEGTSFENSLNLNGLPKNNSINIYVLRQDPNNYFRGLGCNCAYIGSSTILCDENLLTSMTNTILISEVNFPLTIELPNGEESILEYDAVGFINLGMMVFVFQWTIGHEIGHLILGHDSSRYYFQPPTTDLVTLEPLDVDIPRNFEIEADQFVLEHVSRDYGNTIYFGINNFIDYLYHQALKAQGTELPTNVDFTGEIYGRRIKLNLYDGPEPHPPLLIRSLDMMDVVLKSEIAYDNTGYYDDMRATINLVSEGSPFYASVCDTKFFYNP